MCKSKIDKWTSWIPCHRRDDRSFHLFGKKFPICARCTSIFLGYLMTPLLVKEDVLEPWYIILLLVLPMIIDGYTQLWKWRTSNNWLRFLTGSAFGISQSCIIVWGVHFIVHYATV